MSINKYNWFWISVFIAIGSAIYINMANFSVEIDEIIDNDSTNIIESEMPDNQIDIAIKNVIVYPNRFDKNSLYIDIEINNQNGKGLTQITLSNGAKLIASDQIELYNNKHTYFQSFLVRDNIDFESVFNVKISSLKLEENISNNRHSFTTNLKSEKLNIALISGALNYNSKAIIGQIDNDFDHFFPKIGTHEHNFEDFWFKRYDIVIFDNFPAMPISDRWFNLFIKKIYSENTSLIVFKGNQQNLESFIKIAPLFGLDFSSDNELQGISNKTLFSKNHFKSILINDEFLYRYILSGDNTYFEEAIRWVSKDKDLSYKFFLGNDNYYINEPVFIYGFANRVDKEKREFIAHIYKDGIYIKEEKLYLNPISDYYFNQIKIAELGVYDIKIIDKENITIETINVNILEELIKL